eukprot:TRINITY_DN4056_c0_g1_i2.p1 TRINITY_DN4056_c0_g1~~TRINITY_DN4056_c0_g1_i2.p1  ORF type:complete len:821 (-),score=107.30 TRINITY_DN4056_c0_g1_i2:142-2604(-)
MIPGGEINSEALAAWEVMHPWSNANKSVGTGTTDDGMSEDGASTQPVGSIVKPGRDFVQWGEEESEPLNNTASTVSINAPPQILSREDGRQALNSTLSVVPSAPTAVPSEKAGYFDSDERESEAASFVEARRWLINTSSCLQENRPQAAAPRVHKSFDTPAWSSHMPQLGHASPPNSEQLQVQQQLDDALNRTRLKVNASSGVCSESITFPDAFRSSCVRKRSEGASTHAVESEATVLGNQEVHNPPVLLRVAPPVQGSTQECRLAAVQIAAEAAKIAAREPSSPPQPAPCSRWPSDVLGVTPRTEHRSCTASPCAVEVRCTTNNNHGTVQVENVHHSMQDTPKVAAVQLAAAASNNLHKTEIISPRVIQHTSSALRSRTPNAALQDKISLRVSSRTPPRRSSSLEVPVGRMPQSAQQPTSIDNAPQGGAWTTMPQASSFTPGSLTTFTRNGSLDQQRYRHGGGSLQIPIGVSQQNLNMQSPPSARTTIGVPSKSSPSSQWTPGVRRQTLHPAMKQSLLSYAGMKPLCQGEVTAARSMSPTPCRVRQTDFTPPFSSHMKTAHGTEPSQPCYQSPVSQVPVKSNEAGANGTISLVIPRHEADSTVSFGIPRHEADSTVSFGIPRHEADSTVSFGIPRHEGLPGNFHEAAVDTIIEEQVNSVIDDFMNVEGLDDAKVKEMCPTPPRGASQHRIVPPPQLAAQMQSQCRAGIQQQAQLPMQGCTQQMQAARVSRPLQRPLRPQDTFLQQQLPQCRQGLVQPVQSYTPLPPGMAMLNPASLQPVRRSQPGVAVPSLAPLQPVHGSQYLVSPMQAQGAALQHRAR